MCRIRNEAQLGLKIKLAQSFSLIHSLFGVFAALVMMNGFAALVDCILLGV